MYGHGRLVLAPVVVDVAVLALLLGAEVLTHPENGQIDQVTPLDGRGDLHDGLPVGELVPVVLRHRRHADVGDALSVEVEPEQTFVVRRDTVRGGRIHPDRDDRPPQVVGASREDDLLRRAPQRGLAQLGQGAVVEGEDEVGLRFDLARLVVTEGGGVEGHASAQQVLLEDGLPRNMRKPLHQILDQRGTAVHPSLLPAQAYDSSRYAPGRAEVEAGASCCGQGRFHLGIPGSRSPREGRAVA